MDNLFNTKFYIDSKDYDEQIWRPQKVYGYKDIFRDELGPYGGEQIKNKALFYYSAVLFSFAQQTAAGSVSNTLTNFRLCYTEIDKNTGHETEMKCILLI